MSLGYLLSGLNKISLSEKQIHPPKSYGDSCQAGPVQIGRDGDWCSHWQRCSQCDWQFGSRQPIISIFKSPSIYSPEPIRIFVFFCIGRNLIESTRKKTKLQVWFAGNWTCPVSKKKQSCWSGLMEIQHVGISRDGQPGKLRFQVARRMASKFALDGTRYWFPKLQEI